MLHARLAKIDPEAADEIHPNNVKRVIRALEFNHQTGEKISIHNEQERQKNRRISFDITYSVCHGKSYMIVSTAELI